MEEEAAQGAVLAACDDGSDLVWCWSSQQLHAVDLPPMMQRMHGLHRWQGLLLTGPACIASGALQPDSISNTIVSDSYEARELYACSTPAEDYLGHAVAAIQLRPSCATEGEVAIAASAWPKFLCLWCRACMQCSLSVAYVKHCIQQHAVPSVRLHLHAARPA